MNKKDCMKMFHRKKDAPSISEHHIEEVPHDFVQKTETNLKETHPFSKSNSIFFRNKPYLNFNHQKKEKGEDKIQ